MIWGAIIFLLSLGFLLFKNNLSFQKGMAFPVCLLFVINVVYGSYVLHSKPKQLEQTEQQFQSNPKQTFYFELQKVKADDKSYNILKYVWGACVIVFITLYFIPSEDSRKGLFIGFVILFFGFLLIDSFFSQRLRLYLKCFKNYSKQKNIKNNFMNYF